MEIARSRLAPGGILAFNATGSADALATAAAVFPHAYRWSNFVYAAEQDFRAIPPQAVDRLAALRLGAEAFDLRRSRRPVAVERHVGETLCQRARRRDRKWSRAGRDHRCQHADRIQIRPAAAAGLIAEKGQAERSRLLMEVSVGKREASPRVLGG
jgi:hypothetical protein